MAKTELPVEVELAFELMPCQAERVAQEPGGAPHACAYFREWGAYHSFDYEIKGAPKPGAKVPYAYVGRAPLLPEMLSGCRKAPILAVGINPNLPGWWPALRASLNPLFDDYRQYAHYFRYRRTTKPELSAADYKKYGGGPNDTPPGSTLTLNVPIDASGQRTIELHWREQSMYGQYQSLLDGLADAMSWPDHKLAVGEDLSYGNMVACPSAKWTTSKSKSDPQLPPMTTAQRNGIVGECFQKRQYFLRQLFQSLPSIILVFSENTAHTFVGAMEGHFSKGDPQANEPVAKLMTREIVLHLGTLADGTKLESRVLFGPHPTGDPADWAKAKPTIIAQLAECAKQGRVAFNSASGRLKRAQGSCQFCTMLDIGPCDYEGELKALPMSPAVAALRKFPTLAPDKPAQRTLLDEFVAHRRPTLSAWSASDDTSAQPT